ncbi:MAG: glycosyltransferase [Nitrospira sp.]|nr:glycosyltransferase [Nitrospira sp.]MDH4244020.1 glycosyltransferase [Nitrospira sp.]MDH4355892.1 glycosyltransferase [Nitrospira sp.]MDH5317893.1 glycosyltransferase [Nitrospira sp.]
MILVCEMIFDRGAHVPFNAGFLATIRSAFPREDLAFYGAAAHLEQLKKQVGQALAGSILWNEILPIPPGPRYGERFFRELKLIQYLLAKLSQCSTSRMILTSASPSTVLAMKVARLFRSNSPMVQMVLHGLSGVSGKRRRHPLYKFQDMNTAMNLLGNSGIQYLVLEEAIRDRVVGSLPWLAGNIESLEHPISPNEGTNEILDLDEPIRFGFLGTALKSKGYPLFVKAANAITAKYGRRAEFHVIGRGPEESKYVTGTEALATQPAAAPLSREDFIRGVAPLHFIVLPYEPGRYSLAASGVLLDAIAWLKPVIARKIPMLEAIFERYGDIGYLFGDDSELTAVVERVVQAADNSRYRRQALTLRDVRKSRDPETLATVYRELCRLSKGK